MTRNIFDFSRLRVRQARAQQQLYDEGPTAATDTVSESNEGVPSPSDDASQASQSTSVALFSSLSEEEDFENALKSPLTDKVCNKQQPKNSRPTEHPPSQAVVLELQSSIDFLTTKLQQSESHVRALQDQNNQLQMFFEEFLQEQTPPRIQLSETGKEQPETTGGLFDRLKLMEWPSFAGLQNREDSKGSAQTGKASSTNLASENGGVFTREDAIQKMTAHFQLEVQKLVQEREILQNKVQQLKIQNKVQAETMATLEEQLEDDRKQHRSFFDQDDKHALRPSSSRGSKSSSRRSIGYWQQLEHKQIHQREQQEREHHSKEKRYREREPQREHPHSVPHQEQQHQSSPKQGMQEKREHHQHRDHRVIITQSVPSPKSPSHPQISSQPGMKPAGERKQEAPDIQPSQSWQSGKKFLL